MYAIRSYYDLLGRIAWQDDRIVVASSHPMVYYYFSKGLLRGEAFWQINYAFWYEGRRGPNAPWIERGPLDGLTLRISLTADGRPFMIDGMNSCGCYHFFIPDRKQGFALRDQLFALDGFVPQEFPEGFPARPLSVRINSYNFV